MKRVREILNKIFCLPLFQTVILTVPSFALVIYVLTEGMDGPLAYLSYAASTYALIVVLTGFFRIARTVRHRVEQHPLGKQLTKDTKFRAELRRYRLCGIALLLMNLVLTGIVIFMVHQNRGYEYPGVLIYAMAAYAFYSIILATVNVVKFRKYRRPILSAAKAIYLVAAMVSILSLETAMLAQFGGNDDPLFRKAMTGATGGGVCAIVLGMAVYMIVKSTQQLKGIR